MTPMADVEVAGLKGSKVIHAIIDTGFDGFLCLPVETAVKLGLELAGRDVIELADGTEKDELFFKGFVRFLGRKRRVKIYLTQSEDALIGTELLSRSRLLIDFPKELVRLAEKAAHGKSRPSE
jgi:clan AA aspartic protease